MTKTLLRALILLSPIFIYINSYAQIAKTNSVESVNSLEKSKVMNNTIFSIFKNDRAKGKRRNISKVSRIKSANYDFTNVITDSVNRSNIGIIGDSYQRLIIKIDKVKVDPKSKTKYLVSGRSQVKQNITGFDGIIDLQSVYLYDRFDYGVDEEYKNKGLKEQGFAIFDYQLNEDSKQRYSGIFTGKLYAKWYLTNDGNMYYDFINYYSDSYFNNLYYGTWSEYGSSQHKIATWADYKLPQEVVPDLNIGAGEFSPNPKYFKYGWANYSYNFKPF